MPELPFNDSKNGSLYNCLAEVKLDRFYDNFVNSNVTSCEKLASISILDFSRFGVTSMNDRLRLFQLIQIIKSVILKKQNPGFEYNNETSNNQVKKVMSDDHFINTYKFLTHSKLPGELRLDGTKKLEEKMLLEETHRRPRSMTNDGRFKQQDSFNDIQQHSNIFKEITDNEIKAKFDDENVSTNAKTPTDLVEDIQANNHNDTFSGSSGADSDLQRQCFPNYSKSNKGEQDIEKLHVMKETYHNSGYDYGIPDRCPKNLITGPGCKIGIGKPSADKVKVCVRKRPRNQKEVTSNDPDVVTIRGNNTIIVQEQKTALNLSRYIHQHVMAFDEVFDDEKSNEDVYNSTVKPLVSFVLKRGTAICFTFGQTGAGKTHTLIGNKASPGLYQLAGKDLFDSIQIIGDANVWVSFYEIYCGQLFDLLNNRKKLILMEKHSKQVCVTGLMETCATDLRSLIHIVNFGRLHRSKGCSGVNPVSSRSHAVLQMDVRSIETNKRIGRLTFIDLAGSERASDAMKCNKQTRYEGAEINQSLLALKECIRTLDQEQSYTPYRQSKLTHILRESFSGNCQSVMIANISPTLTACENTLNTLRYADRVQELKRGTMNKVKVIRRKSKESHNPSVTRNSDFSSSSPNGVVTDKTGSLSNSEIGHASRILPLSIKFPPSDTLSLILPRDGSAKPSRNIDDGRNFRSVDKISSQKRYVSHTEHAKRNQCIPYPRSLKAKLINDNQTCLPPHHQVRPLTSERHCLSQNGRSCKSEKPTSSKKKKAISKASCHGYLNKLHEQQSQKCKKELQTVFLLRSSQITHEIARSLAAKSPIRPKISANRAISSEKQQRPNSEGKTSPSTADNENKSISNKNDDKLFVREDNYEKESSQPPNSSSISSKTFPTTSDESRTNDTDETSDGHEKKASHDSLNALINSITDTTVPNAPINYVLNSETLLINAHEKHLDSVTQLCREEIDLLMKLRTGKMPFHNYVSKIHSIMLTRKQMSDALISHIGQFESFNNSLS